MNWSAPFASGPLDATVTVPGSKSLTNRMLPLAAIAAEPSEITGVLSSRDSDLMIAALQQLGVSITPGSEPDSLRITPPTLSGDSELNQARFTPGGRIDCGLAGTVMRFVPPLAALARGVTTFDGDPHARLRPMAGLVAGLRELGIQVSADALPLQVTGTGSVRGGEITVDASDSSQFISAILMAAPAFEQGVLIHHQGESLPSLPHIEMTIAELQERGVDAAVVGPASWQVKPGPVRGGQMHVEPDLSNAGPFLAAALVAGGTVRIPHWPSHTTQPGDLWREILPQFGAQVTFAHNTLTVHGDGSIQAVDLDLSAAGELAPVAIALAALADGASQVRGIAHLRGHETNRLHALVTEINRFGGSAEELADGIRVDAPIPVEQGIDSAVTALTYDDHRMAHFAAIIGLRRAHTFLDDVACTSKTMPHFPQMWHSMVEGDGS